MYIITPYSQLCRYCQGICKGRFRPFFMVVTVSDIHVDHPTQKSFTLLFILLLAVIIYFSYHCRRAVTTHSFNWNEFIQNYDQNSSLIGDMSSPKRETTYLTNSDGHRLTVASSHPNLLPTPFVFPFRHHVAELKMNLQHSAITKRWMGSCKMVNGSVVDRFVTVIWQTRDSWQADATRLTYTWLIAGTWLTAPRCRS